ncbi:6-phospho-3-hexuloisomerase [Methanolapillus ohkumae]|uniref:3-hexulose-6-phosphate isomerase n=1 Tax=Methanolapillus ohkumae TaxID=3028298 RepID=A0AA96ZWW5_9EURY|nr:3-hexulose-6-phosphate isomerase [Methanosarcinaceae archaeon Am2]
MDKKNCCASNEISKFTVQSSDLVFSTMNSITEQIRSVSGSIQKQDVCAMLEEIVDTKKSGGHIFVSGAGRSGLMGKAFAMRLMHMGFDAFVVAETTTPAIKAEDVLLAISGSGTTASVLNAAQKSKKAGAKIIGITSKEETELGKLSDVNVVLPSKSKADDIKNNTASSKSAPGSTSAPMGTSFEIFTLIFLDSIVAQLIEITGVSEDEMKARHANLE